MNDGYINKVYNEVFNLINGINVINKLSEKHLSPITIKQFKKYIYMDNFYFDAYFFDSLNNKIGNIVFNFSTYGMSKQHIKILKNYIKKYNIKVRSYLYTSYEIISLQFIEYNLEIFNKLYSFISLLISN